MNEPYDAPFEAWDVLPRIGLSKTLGDWGNWFFQTSTGFSDPTNFESLSTDVEGALLNPLRAEEALTFETGLRFEQAECVFYHQTVGNAIVQVIENDIESFINETNPLTMVGLEGAWNQRFKRHSVRLTGALQMHVRDSGWPPVSFTDGGLLGNRRAAASPARRTGRPMQCTPGKSGSVNIIGICMHGSGGLVLPH